MTKSNIDLLDIEQASDEIVRSITLLNLQQEELDDFYSATVQTEKAKTDAELAEAKGLLMIQCQNRYKFLETLNLSVSDILFRLKNHLEQMTGDEIESNKQARKESK